MIDIQRDIECVNAANEAADERAKSEEAQRPKMEAAKRAAELGLEAIRVAAEHLDATLASVLKAAEALKLAGEFYTEEHAGLNIHSSAMTWLNAPIKELVKTIKAQKSLAADVPDLAFVMTGKRPHRTKEDKLKSLGPMGLAQIERRNAERARNGLPMGA